MLMAPVGCAVFGLDLKTVLRSDRETMTKLSGLISGVAQTLKVPVTTVNTAAAQLRKHKLLTSGPRGPGAPEMGPSDMTNLLLALMFDDELKNVHINVPMLRSAPLQSWLGVMRGGRRTEGPPPHRFTKTEDQSQPALLGDVLDLMFDWQVRSNGLDETDEDAIEAKGYTEKQMSKGDFDPNLYLYVDNLAIYVERPIDTVHVRWTSYAVHWDLWYSHPKPDLEAKADQEMHRMGLPPDGMVQQAGGHRYSLRPTLYGLMRPFMATSRSIDWEAFTALADVLRGFEWPDEHRVVEISPPYDDHANEPNDPASRRL